MVFSRWKKSALAVAMMLSVTSCSSCDDPPECTRSSDCNTFAGEICRSGKCVPDPFANTSGSTPIDSGTGRTPYIGTSQGDTGSTTADDSDSGSDTGVQDTSVNTGCISNSGCDDQNSCTSDLCDKSVSPYQCVHTPKADGLTCGADDPCLGHATCQQGICTAAASPCADWISDDGCMKYVGSCDAGNVPVCSYTEIPVNDNSPCLQGTACLQGVCADGACVNVGSPCESFSNMCTATACEPVGDNVGDFECSFSTAPDGQTCVLLASDSQCNTSASSDAFIKGFCVNNGVYSDCVPGDERKCYDASSPNICSATMCVPEDGTCIDVPPLDVSIHVTCEGYAGAVSGSCLNVTHCQDF